MDLKYYCKGVCDHYPEYLIEDRLSIEGNIIGCLAKDLLILMILRQLEMISLPCRVVFLQSD